jgi:hypothetical protein
MLICAVVLSGPGFPVNPVNAIRIPMLVDTGADTCVLHPQEALRFFRTQSQWDWLRQQRQALVGGAGQGRPHYEVDAVIYLTHTDGAIDSSPVALFIAEPHPGNIELESLLGRDVLGHYQALFDQNRALTLVRPSG